jgi:hypothetical protein
MPAILRPIFTAAMDTGKKAGKKASREKEIMVY